LPQGKQVEKHQASRDDLNMDRELFLEPTISFQVAQQLAGANQLPITAQTLRHRLREHGLLASIDAGRQMLLVRRTLEGNAKQVLHLRASALMNPAGAAV
jgi:hypothetical protein